MYNFIHVETRILLLYGISRLLYVMVKECAKSMTKKTESLNKIQIKLGL
jgi:hypothetical protein